MEDQLKDFDDIRPYKDDELSEVVSRISRNRWLLSGFMNVLWPRCPSIIAPVFMALEGFYLRMILHKVKTVDEFQKQFVIRQGLYMVVRQTTDGVTFNGLSNLDPKKGYLFLSNHRDISLDSALLNYALYKAELPLSQIAFGDNLLINQFVSDMIRINKAFIVRRNLPIREQIKASIQLSRYIWFTLSQGHSVWLAQREGRAKDGNDLTNPSVIKMLYLSQRNRKEGLTFPDFIKACNIVPMSISYELDPCDRIKAWEIYHKESKGEHVKRKKEDLVSLYAGIKGKKGRIHIEFGEPITETLENEKEVSAWIDKTIHACYHLWPSNFIAFDELEGQQEYIKQYSHEERNSFLSRFTTLPEKVRKVALDMYANPVRNYRLAVSQV